MDEGQPTDKGSDKVGKKPVVILAAVAIVAVIMVAAVMSGALNTAGSEDEDRLITKANAELVLSLDDLPAGWSSPGYSSYSYTGTENITESGAIRFNNTAASYPDQVEVVTLTIIRFDSIEDATFAFNETYGESGADHWQGVDLQTVGRVDVGDVAVLCSGNWTWSHAAIKTIVLRENNVITWIVYEAAEGVGLSDETLIALAEKQAAKLLS